MSGWLKFHRAMLGHAVWSLPPGQVKVWFTILAMANLRPADWHDGKERVTIQTGSLLTSQEHLAKAARVTRKVVRMALEKLEQMDSIRAKVRANRWTLIEVLNWPIYQASASEEGQPRANPNRAEGPTGGPTDLRGGNSRGGPTGGPTENAEEGHNLRSSTERRKQLPTGARSIRRGGGAADGGTPRPPVEPAGMPRSLRTAAKKVQRERRLHPAGADQRYTLGQLEAIAGIADPRLVPAPLEQPAGASESSRVFEGQASPGSVAGGDGAPPTIREGAGTGAA